MVEVYGKFPEVFFDPGRSPGGGKEFIDWSAWLDLLDIFPADSIPGQLKMLGGRWIKEKISMIGKRVGERADEGTAVMAQSGSVVKSPFGIESYSHGTKITTDEVVTLRAGQEEAMRKFD